MSAPKLFMQSFRDAAKNADGIIFDVTHFDYKLAGVTRDELMHIVGNDKLLSKTVFTKNGREVKWTGVGFD
jgi:hypothetical protein